MIKLIIFDWDDVFVVGAKEGYLACFKKALHDYNFNLDDKTIQQVVHGMWGQPNHIIIKKLLGPDHSNLLPKVVKNYRQYKKDETFLGHLRFISHGNTFLKAISQKYLLAIATSQEREVLQDYIFPKFNVADVFNTTFSSHDFEDPKLAKPNPHMITQLLKKFHLKTSETVMVGDAENDVLMAKAAGVEPIVVLTGHLNKEKAKKLGVKHIIADVTKLETVLATL